MENLTQQEHIDTVFELIRENGFNNHVTRENWFKFKLELDKKVHEYLVQYNGNDYLEFSKWVYFYAYTAIMNTKIYDN